MIGSKIVALKLNVNLEEERVRLVRQREKGAPISGPIFQAKALALYMQFPVETKGFKASIGWLNHWKNRHGVRELNICGEKLSGDT